MEDLTDKKQELSADIVDTIADTIGDEDKDTLNEISPVESQAESQSDILEETKPEVCELVSERLAAKESEARAAERVKIKRQLKRKRAYERLKQSLIVVSLLFALGITIYVIGVFTTLRGPTRDANAKASEIVSPQIESLYNAFVTVGDTNLSLALPGKTGDVIGVGFHEAERKEAYAMKPMVNCFNRESTVTVRNAFMNAKAPVLFVMNSRGRGSAPTSAMDIAMVSNAKVYSPVDGVVTQVMTYNLYNKVMDYHVEIQPDGFPDLRVAIIHIENVQVAVGQRVTRRQSLIGTMRALPEVQSQILKYLPKPEDHVHIQVNPSTVKGNLGS